MHNMTSHVYRLKIIVSLSGGSYGFSPTTEVELDDASPALRYLKSASDGGTLMAFQSLIKTRLNAMSC
jgi:hypothetical protein